MRSVIQLTEAAECEQKEAARVSTSAFNRTVKLNLSEPNRDAPPPRHLGIASFGGFPVKQCVRAVLKTAEANIMLASSPPAPPPTIRSFFTLIPTLLMLLLLGPDIQQVHGLRCYSCSVTATSGDKRCISDPASVEGQSIVTCSRKYCTILRQELLVSFSWK